MFANREPATPTFLRIPATATALPAHSNGFDPRYDGFSFRNYGFDARLLNMIPADVARLFGTDVCVGKQTTPCILIPAADVWMQEINRAMQTGHCEGMAVLSQYFYYGIVSPDSFGAAQTADLVLVDNPALQREIAYWWATQATFPTRAHRTIIDAKALLGTLAKTLAADARIDVLFTIGMYQRDFSRGHTVTPIGMHYIDAGNAVIELYDNNIPNETRTLSVDVVANSWTYTAPNVDGTLVTYAGDATSKNLELTAAAPRMEQQFCHFCPSNPTVDTVEDLTTFFFSSSATSPQRTPVPLSVYFVDALKRRVGIVLGIVTNEIPGATISFLRGEASSWSPLGMPTIAVPPDITGSLSITGVADVPLNVSSFGSGGVASVQNLLVTADAESSLYLDQQGGQVVVASAIATQPNIVVGYTDSTQNVTIIAESVPLLPGGKLALQADKTTNAVAIYGTNPEPIRITTSTRDNAGNLSESEFEQPATDATLADALSIVETLPADKTAQPTVRTSRTPTPVANEVQQTPLLSVDSATIPPDISPPTDTAISETATEVATETPLPSETAVPTDTREPTERRPTRPVIPTLTDIPIASNTAVVPSPTPLPANTQTNTQTVIPTDTSIPVDTNTPTPAPPTNTPDPAVTPSDTPLPTDTPLADTATATRTRRPTATIPPPTATPWWCDWSNLCFNR